jgi:acetolactate synthase-1/2/3 large subunit
MTELRERLAKAKRPLAILGGGGWDAQAVADFAAFAKAMNIPVGTSFRCQDLIDNDHPCYAGDVGIGLNPKLAERVKSADLLLVVGARLGEMTTSGYTLIEPPVPKQALVHVHASAEELGRVYQSVLPINSGMAGFAAMAKALAPVAHSAWDQETKTARADYEAWQKHSPNAGDVQMGEIIAHLRATLPADAILTNGAGNYSSWLHRFYRFRKYKTYLGPTNGSMGYGVPSAVAAKLVHPERTVVSFNGDGCFLMNGQELATAVQHQANVVFLVINNGMYGTIRMHQERDYPARVSGTELKNPDFAALARAYGAHGETVVKTEEFAPAFERCLKAGTPALIEVKLDPEAITSRTTLSAIRETALKKK